MTYILTTGNPIDGTTLTGPFPSREDAEEEAHALPGGMDWWVVPVSPVTAPKKPKTKFCALHDHFWTNSGTHEDIQQALEHNMAADILLDEESFKAMTNSAMNLMDAQVINDYVRRHR